MLQRLVLSIHRTDVNIAHYCSAVLFLLCSRMCRIGLEAEQQLLQLCALEMKKGSASTPIILCLNVIACMHNFVYGREYRIEM
eukprot:362082-Chlamydomonas_euryale.AAC.4